ncbi:MAG: NAD-dependent epimerase/dehydratase family protein, partial [Bacteroidota bacterium]
MNILISGGTGLVGRALVPILQSQGHDVTILTTRKSMSGNTREGVRYIWWNPARHEFPAQEMEWA